MQLQIAIGESGSLAPALQTRPVPNILLDIHCGVSSCLAPHQALHRTSKLYVRPSKLTFMTAGALAPHVGVSVFFQSGSMRSQNSQCVSRLAWGMCHAVSWRSSGMECWAV